MSAVLVHQVDIVVRLTSFDEAGDVGMLDVLKNQNLALELLPLMGFVEFCLPDDPYREVELRSVLVDGSVVGEPTTADGAREQIVRANMTMTRSRRSS